MQNLTSKFIFMIIAVTCLVETSWSKAGFYCGAGAGTQIRRDKFKLTEGELAVRHKVSDHTQTLIGDILLGYGFEISGFYLGGEVDYSFGSSNNNKVSIADGVLRAKIKSDDALSGRILFGKYVGDDTLIYAGLGAEGRRFTLSVDAGVNDINSAKSTEVGFVWSLGVMTPVTENVYIRGEFKQSYFDNIKETNATTILTNSKPRVDTFMIAVVFNLSSLMG